MRGMDSTSRIALSGMQAALAGLQSSAHNIANASTEGFRRQQVRQTPAAGGGVTVQAEQAAMPGAALERDLVDQLVAKHAFLANLAAFRAANERTGTLLDLRT